MSHKKSNIYSLIIAGGSGTRLWPVSRDCFPKQFSRLLGEESLIQSTIKRVSEFTENEKIFVVLGEDHKFDIERHLQELSLDKDVKIITEPCAKNTAPAILLGTLEILKHDKEAIIFIFPSDHVIRDENNFYSAIEKAASLALKDRIVTFGIKPDKPETGYGYIEGGEEFAEGSFSIKRFTEKPDMKTANEYIESGNYFWNSGIFAFRASLVVDEFKEHAPEILERVQSSMSPSGRVNIVDYKTLPSISFDYAIMEKTSNSVVLPSGFYWNDIGSWGALYELMPTDVSGNSISGDVITEDSSNCFVRGSSRLVALNSLSNIAVIDTDDAIFISDLRKTQCVKEIVSKLKSKKRPETIRHKKVYKPWGYYVDMHSGAGFHVKRISVLPGKRLSLQKHKYRSENWVVIEGTATVRNGDDTYDLSARESTFIPVGSIHRLENKTEKPLQLIEVQFGANLSEEDIERIEDDFGRI